MADWDNSGDEGLPKSDNFMSKSNRTFDDNFDRSKPIFEKKNSDNYLSLSDEERRVTKSKKLSDEIDSQVYDRNSKVDEGRNRRNYEDLSPYKTSKQNNDETESFRERNKNFDNENKNDNIKFSDEDSRRQKKNNDDEFKSKVSDDWDNESSMKKGVKDEGFTRRNDNEGDTRRSYRSNENNEGDGEERRFGRRNFNDNEDENRRSNRRNDDSDNRGFRRNDNDDSDNRGFRRNDNDNSDNRGFRRNDNDNNDNRGFRRNNNDNNDNRGFRRNDNEGEDRRSGRRNDNDDDNRRPNRRNFDENDGENRRSNRRNDDDNNDNRGFRRNDNDDGNRRSNRRNDNDEGDRRYGRRNENDENRGFRRNFDENDGESRRSNRRNDDDNNDNRGFRRNDNEGEDRRSGRKNDNDDNRRSNRRNDNDEGDRRSGRRNDNDDDNRRPNRRNFDDNDGDNRRSGRRNDNEEDGGERRSSRKNDNDNENRGSRRNFDNDDGENTDDKPKEKYIPPTYTKEDDELFYNISEGINFSKFEKIPVKKIGEDIPDPIESFTDATKHKSLHEAISKSNYKTLTPIQKHSIPIISEGRDLMAAAQTGSGKTVTFLLPLIEKLLNNPDSLNKEKGFKCSPEVVIISPTRELAIQIYQQALKLTFRNDIKSSLIYGGANYFDQKNRLCSDSNIVVATPGRLAHFLEKELISFSETKYLVLDEADRLVDQGFIPQVENIVFGFDLPKKRQTLMFSATFSETVQELAKKFLKDDFIFISIGILGAANSDVEQEIILTTYREKKNLLLETVKKIYHPKTKILVFTDKKKTTDFIALTLSLSDFQSTSFHGDRLQSQREHALDLFKKGETPILVATSAASRGLDIKGVEYVINYDIPKEIDEYVHRIGRTGRLGNFGKAISFYDPDENSSIKSSLVKILKDSNQKIPDFLDDGDNYDGSGYSYNNSSYPDEIKTEKREEVSQLNNEDDDW